MAVTEGVVEIIFRTDGRGNAPEHIGKVNNALGNTATKAKAAEGAAAKLFATITAPGKELAQVRERLNAITTMIGLPLAGDFLLKGVVAIGKALYDLSAAGKAEKDFAALQASVAKTTGTLAGFIATARGASAEIAALAADIARANAELAKGTNDPSAKQAAGVAAVLGVEKQRLEVAAKQRDLELQQAEAGKAIGQAAAESVSIFAKRIELQALLGNLQGATQWDQEETQRRLLGIQSQGIVLQSAAAAAAAVLKDVETERIKLAERQAQMLREQALIIRTELLPQFKLFLDGLELMSSAIMTTMTASFGAVANLMVRPFKEGLRSLQVEYEKLPKFTPGGPKATPDSGKLRGLDMPSAARVFDPGPIPGVIGAGAGLDRIFDTVGRRADRLNDLGDRMARERAKVEKEANLTIAGLKAYQLQLQDLLAEGGLSDGEKRQAEDRIAAAGKRIVDIEAEVEQKRTELVDQGARERASIRQQEIDDQIAGMSKVLGPSIDMFTSMQRYGRSSEQLFSVLVNGTRAIADNWGDIVAKKDGVISAMAATTTAGIKNERTRASIMVLAAAADAGVALARGNIAGAIAAGESVLTYALIAGGAGGGGASRGREPVRRTARAVDGSSGGGNWTVNINAPWFGPSMQEFGRYMGGIVRSVNGTGFEG